MLAPQLHRYGATVDEQSHEGGPASVVVTIPRTKARLSRTSILTRVAAVLVVATVAVALLTTTTHSRKLRSPAQDSPSVHLAASPGQENGKGIGNAKDKPPPTLLRAPPPTATYPHESEQARDARHEKADAEREKREQEKEQDAEARKQAAEARREKEETDAEAKKQADEARREKDEADAEAKKQATGTGASGGAA